MRMEWILSKPILLATTTTESRYGLPSGGPVEGVPLEGSLLVAPSRRCPSRGGHPGGQGLLPRVDTTESEGPVPRDTDYPIPTVVVGVSVPEVSGFPNGDMIRMWCKRREGLP